MKKIYTVYTKSKKDFTENLVFIEEGFSFKAAIFNIFWALYHQIWWLAALALLINSIFSFLEAKHLFSDKQIILSHLFANIIIGLYANDFYRKDLANKGYHMIDIIYEKDISEAKFRFFEKITK